MKCESYQSNLEQCVYQVDLVIVKSNFICIHVMKVVELEFADKLILVLATTSSIFSKVLVFLKFGF